MDGAFLNNHSGRVDSLCMVQSVENSTKTMYGNVCQCTGLVDRWKPPTPTINKGCFAEDEDLLRPHKDHGVAMKHP